MDSGDGTYSLGNRSGEEGNVETSETAEQERGTICPNTSALQEMRNCNEHACIVYHWQTGPWGPCMEDTSVTTLNSTATGSKPAPSGTDKPSCAMGMQTRKVICVKVNVGQVPPKNHKYQKVGKDEDARICVGHAGCGTLAAITLKIMMQ
ncbi:hypothetical protein NFI96_007055 [Prochilodus magdalenae]|nr:hypothetical protein NFI96_007055 [Prochilodus magdalenae]